MKTIKVLLVALAGLVFSGCSTPLPNSAVRNAADIWVGKDDGTGRWSAKPGDSDIEIIGVDSKRGDFPPLRYLDTAADLSAPLHLAPGRHSIALIAGTVFPVYMGPTHVSESVQTKGSGTIEWLFLPNHAYRITAMWIDGPAHGSGTFEVTLWNVPESDSTPTAMQLWRFRGWEVAGPLHYVSP